MSRKRGRVAGAKDPGHVKQARAQVAAAQERQRQRELVLQHPEWAEGAIADAFAVTMIRADSIVLATDEQLVAIAVADAKVAAMRHRC